MRGYKVLDTTVSNDVMAGKSASTGHYVEYYYNKPAYPYPNTALFVFSTLEYAQNYVKHSIGTVFECEYEPTELIIDLDEVPGYMGNIRTILPWTFVGDTPTVYPQFISLPAGTVFAKSVKILNKV